MGARSASGGRCSRSAGSPGQCSLVPIGPVAEAGTDLSIALKGPGDGFQLFDSGLARTLNGTAPYPKKRHVRVFPPSIGKQWSGPGHFEFCSPLWWRPGRRHGVAAGSHRHLTVQAVSRSSPSRLCLPAGATTSAAMNSRTHVIRAISMSEVTKGAAARVIRSRRMLLRPIQCRPRPRFLASSC